MWKSKSVPTFDMWLNDLSNRINLERRRLELKAEATYLKKIYTETPS